MALTKVTGQVIKNTTDVTVGVLTVTNTLAVGGTVSIGGTLTYEDVTNVDAVGLITARNGIVVGSGITLSKDGDIFATGISTVKGIHINGTLEGEDLKVGTGVTITRDGDIFATGISTFADGVRIVGGSNSSDLTVITSNNDVGIFSGTTSGANIQLFDNDTQNQIRTVDGRLHISADVGESVADSEIRFLVDSSIKARISTGSSFSLGDDSDTFISRASANTLAVTTGGNERLRITSGGDLLVGHTVSVGSGQLQSYTGNQDAIDILGYNSTATHSGRLTFYRSKTGTVGNNTEVANGDSLGRIDFRGYNDDGTAFNIGATVEAVVNGNVDSTTDMPSALLFKTSEEGSATPTERLRISPGGIVLVGATDPRTVNSRYASLQVQGTSGGSSALSIVRNSGNNSGPHIDFAKSRSGSLGDNTVVNDGDNLGEFTFSGADGTDLHEAGRIICQVDGTPADDASDMPGRLIFSTTSDGSGSATERLRITKNGDVLIGGTNEITDCQVAINGNIAQYNSSTGTGAVMKSFVLSRSYAMSTSGTNVLTFDNWGTSAFDISVFRRDNSSPAGAQLVKVYLAFHGSGTNITQATLAQENKVLRGSIHNIDYSISENNNTATLTATGDDNGGETQDLTFYILARGNAAGEITVV